MHTVLQSRKVIVIDRAAVGAFQVNAVTRVAHGVAADHGAPGAFYVHPIAAVKDVFALFARDH